MKNKVWSLITIFILSIFIPAIASEIEVQPAMLSRSNEQDRVWAGTFQIAWNELLDKYTRMPVRFRESTPMTAKELNRKSFTGTSLSEKCYYKYLGKVNKNTQKIITKALKKKFNETSDILDGLDFAPNSSSFLIYTMLKKDFEFTSEYDKLGVSKFGKDMTAQYFGIDANTDSEKRQDIKVLYYNNQYDFAIILPAKGNDEVYLYKNGANKDFQSLYKDMTVKASKYTGSKTFNGTDELQVPEIKFDITKTFNELTSQRIMGTNLTIGQAVETIQFNMDNKVVQPKSEAEITVETAFSQTDEEENIGSRYFYLDNTFVIFLKEKPKGQTRTQPYFALRVNDIRKFQ